jgi:hypothetical protein
MSRMTTLPCHSLAQDARYIDLFAATPRDARLAPLEHSSIAPGPTSVEACLRQQVKEKPAIVPV